MRRPDYPISTSRLLLRPFRADDFDALYAIQSRPDVTRYLYWDARDKDQVGDALSLRINESTLRAEGDVMHLAVVRQDTGEVIGDGNLEWTSEESRQGELGFVFNPDHHGHGYATETAIALLGLGFDHFGLHRVYGRCDGRNTASAKVMERAGMRREAHLIQNEIVKGEWTDELVYAMLAEEWQRR